MAAVGAGGSQREEPWPPSDSRKSVQEPAIAGSGGGERGSRRYGVGGSPSGSESSHQRRRVPGGGRSWKSGWVEVTEG